MNKKRVLLTSPTGLGNGGVQYVLMTVVRNLSDKYIFDILLFNREQDYYKEEFLSYGGSIYYFDYDDHGNALKKLLQRRQLYKYVLNILKKNKYDVVHANSVFLDAPIIKAAYKAGVKARICHAHGSYPNPGFFRSIIWNNARREMDKYSTALLGVSKQCCSTFYSKDSKYQVVYNPYDEKNIRTIKDKPENLTLLQVGQYCDNKNQLFSLEVINEIKKEISNCKLILVGTSDAGFIKNRIKELDIENNVELYEHNVDKTVLYPQSSYFILPSKREGASIVLVEAQASGMYCFASDTVPQDVNCGGVTYLSLKNGPERWAKEIIKFYKTNKSEKSSFDCSRFKTDNFIKTISTLYDK